MSRVMRKPAFSIYAKTKPQISFTVTAKLISAFVFATKIVLSLFFLNPKFQASSHLLWLYSPVCVGSGQNPRRPVFSERGSLMTQPIPDTRWKRKENSKLKAYWHQLTSNRIAYLKYALKVYFT